MSTVKEMILDLATGVLALIVVGGYLALLILGKAPDDTYKTMAVSVVVFYFAQRQGQRAVAALRDSNAQLTTVASSAVQANTDRANGAKNNTPSA